MADDLRDSEMETLQARAEAAEASLRRARNANRRLTAALIASAHLLDVPFTNAPELSPWTRSVKPAMAALKAALAPPASVPAPPKETPNGG
jgi:hypothetical protein